jgi:hypothetical protein
MNGNSGQETPHRDGSGSEEPQVGKSGRMANGLSELMNFDRLTKSRR